MKVFVSSLIAGYEQFRAGARRGIVTLRHQPIMAEDFGAQPNSPQVACLRGLREADAVVLMLGEYYGAVQSASGLSATHEEYREARGKKPVIAFVEANTQPEPSQAAFIDEVQGWEHGLFRGSFEAADDLQAAVTQALHDLELANAVANTSREELRGLATGMLPSDQRHYRHVSGAILNTAIVSGPRQQMIRPAEIESSSFIDGVHQAALFGDAALLDSAAATDKKLEGSALTLSQETGASISLDEAGALLISLPLDAKRSRFESSHMDGSVIVEERVHSALSSSLAFGAWVLERIDPTQRLSHAAIATSISGAEHRVWRTQAEHNSNPNSVQFGFGQSSEQGPVVLDRPRPALRLDKGRLVEDLLVPLRRRWKRPG